MLDLQNKLGNILTNAHALLITFEIMPKFEKNIPSYEAFYSLLPWMKKLSKKSYLLFVQPVFLVDNNNINNNNLSQYS